MLKTKLEKFERELEKNNYESEHNDVSIIEITDFLIDNNVEVDFNKIVKFCDLIFTDDSVLDCDALIDAFIEAFENDKNKVLKLLNSDVNALFDLLNNEED